MVEKGTMGAEAWTDKAIAWHSAAISYNLAASWKKMKKLMIENIIKERYLERFLSEELILAPINPKCKDGFFYWIRGRS